MRVDEKQQKQSQYTITIAESVASFYCSRFGEQPNAIIKISTFHFIKAVDYLPLLKRVYCNFRNVCFDIERVCFKIKGAQTSIFVVLGNNGFTML